MAYIVIKIIKGKPYRYLQWSFRIGKKVRTKSRYLGPGSSLKGLGPVKPRKRRSGPRTESAEEREHRIAAAEEYSREMGRLDREEKQLDEDQRKKFGETAAERGAREHQEKLESLHDAYGLHMPSYASQGEEDGGKIG